MRDYEITIIVQPELDNEAREALIERITGWISDGNEDNKPKMDVWGQRRMAYPIRKFKNGFYVYYEAQMDPARVRELEQNLQFTEDILRYLVVRQDEE